MIFKHILVADIQTHNNTYTCTYMPMPVWGILHDASSDVNLPVDVVTCHPNPNDAKSLRLGAELERGLAVLHLSGSPL